ncbi:hypothetical protein SY88_11785 [Clostridiales bacterium PH28_bin88]|nr:hypothetical protein SY88_11785 [Clostridiales bacterium PH28_bin88]
MGKVKLSPKGQIVIPAPLRKKYGIGPGSVVEVIDGGDRIMLRLVPEDPVEEAMGMLRGRTSLTKELLRSRQEERTLEERKLIQSPSRSGKGD